MWALIATGNVIRRCKKGGRKTENNNINADKVIVEVISDIEDFPNYTGRLWWVA